MAENRFARDSAPDPEWTNEPASLSHPTAPPAEPVPAKTGIEPLISDCLDETFAPEGRKPRHDGWTPVAVAGFLEHLAAHGVVGQAAQAVGLSASAAYAFRNRRAGRAFARMWDAILIHRGRARLAAENQAYATCGCVSRRYDKDGELAGEYHYRDNRLAMAMLTRLDRLAEREAPADDHLRALSEDFDDFLDCVRDGGDLDAFVEARKPAPAAAAEPPALPRQGHPRTPAERDEADLETLARLSGEPSWRGVPPHDIPVDDLDPSREADWTPEQRLRAMRSGFLIWLETSEAGPGFVAGPGTPVRFAAKRDAARALVVLEEAAGGCAGPPPGYRALRDAGRTSEIDTADLDPALMGDWTGDQWARAHCSGFLARIPATFWEDPAAGIAPDGVED